MSGLRDKLNVLVKSNLRSVLGGGMVRRIKIPGAAGLGRDMDREIAALRARINQALDDEDRLKAEIGTLNQAVSEWDAQADTALAAGDEAGARYAAQQMQLKQQQIAMLAADLEQHRYSAQELIRQVNELEAVVAEARHHQAQRDTADDTGSDAGAGAASDAGTAGGSDAASGETAANPLAARIQRARELITGAGPDDDSDPAVVQPVHTVTSPVTDKQTGSDDDLADRRARLSQ